MAVTSKMKTRCLLCSYWWLTDPLWLIQLLQPVLTVNAAKSNFDVANFCIYKNEQLARREQLTMIINRYHEWSISHYPQSCYLWHCVHGVRIPSCTVAETEMWWVQTMSSFGDYHDRKKWVPESSISPIYRISWYIH